MKKIAMLFLMVAMVLAVAACSPKEGSIEWCEDMDKENKGDWTSNDVKIYAENCVFRKSK